MHGKREYPRRRSRLAGVLALFAATALLTTAVTSSFGVESPVETPLPAASAPAEEPRTAQALPAAPAENQKTRAVMPEVELPPAPAEPVEETPAVKDSYFTDAAFLGDSRTDGFRLYSGLGTGTYFVATGATVESVFTKKVTTDAGEMPLLDALAQTEDAFRRIYVMLGVNELGWSDPNDYYTQYGLLIDRLRADHPEAEVILQTNLPVSRQQDEKKSYVNNTRIACYNEIVRKLAGEKACPLVDAAEAVTDEEGFLRKDWTYDGVHLNQRGCKAWLAYLRIHAVGYTEEEVALPETGEAPAQQPVHETPSPAA